jgi:peroxiredoxin
VAAFQLDLPKFESRNAQVVGISTDFPMTQAAWAEKMGLTFPLVSDWQRKALPALGILDTDPNSVVYRYAKRAYLIIDKEGIVRYRKVLDDPLQLVSNDELLAELDKLNR